MEDKEERKSGGNENKCFGGGGRGGTLLVMYKTIDYEACLASVFHLYINKGQKERG